MTTTDIKLLTADDLLRLYSQGLRGELIREVLSERRPGGVESGEIIGLVAFEIGNFLNRHNLGRATIGAGFWLEREPDTVRRAQVAFISSQKLPPSQRVSGYSQVAPDLVVDVQGFNRDVREVFDKLRMWLSYGVRLVWVVHPTTRSVDVHRPQLPVETIREGGSLDGLAVLPGLSCELSSIFRSADL